MKLLAIYGFARFVDLCHKFRLRRMSELVADAPQNV